MGSEEPAMSEGGGKWLCECRQVNGAFQKRCVRCGAPQETADVSGRTKADPMPPSTIPSPEKPVVPARVPRPSAVPSAPKKRSRGVYIFICLVGLGLLAALFIAAIVLNPTKEQFKKYIRGKSGEYKHLAEPGPYSKILVHFVCRYERHLLYSKYFAKPCVINPHRRWDNLDSAGKSMRFIGIFGFFIRADFIDVESKGDNNFDG